jgi:ketosteroid isomerase-like protein
VAAKLAVEEGGMTAANHEIILAYLDANMVADRAGMARYLAADVKMWIPRSGTQNLNTPNPITGRDTILDFLARARAAFYAPNAVPTYSVIHAFSAQDMGMVHFGLNAKTANGAIYENTYIMLARVNAGVIAEFWEFTDTTHAFAAFGAGGKG